MTFRMRGAALERNTSSPHGAHAGPQFGYSQSAVPGKIGFQFREFGDRLRRKR